MRSPAIVFLIFNRPSETAQTFEAIRAARPSELFVVADGPRSYRPSDLDLCERTRGIIDQVDWPCQVRRNFSDENMGCGKRVSSGLDWAFAQVEGAIILEDDCLPDSSFFPYCAELLERYRDDERVMMVSGNNFQNGRQRTSDSYYFSQLPHIWGWATWRRAWQHYDFAIHDWRIRGADWLRSALQDDFVVHKWSKCFDDISSRAVDTWDYQWVYCMLSRNALSAVPNVNLVENIGFGNSAATHTVSTNDVLVVPRRQMPFPLRHPSRVERCEAADEFEIRYLNSPNLLTPLPKPLWSAFVAMKKAKREVGRLRKLVVPSNHVAK
jgi:hypothetical protein